MSDKKPETWSYKMFNDAKLMYSCVIQNSEGDTICRMLRSDAPNNAIQEERAKKIVASNDLLELAQRFCDSVVSDKRAWENQVNYWSGEFRKAIQKAKA